MTSHIVKGFIIKEKTHDVNWAIIVACTTKEKAWRLEVMALKYKGT
jgi:hypothetical protein